MDFTSSGFMFILYALLALAALGCFLLWRQRGQDKKAIEDLRLKLDQQSTTSHENTLRAAQLEARLDGQLQRFSDLSEERDGMNDALYQARQTISKLQSDLATAHLAAQKDHEAAQKEISTLRELREEMTAHFRVLANETMRSQGADMQKAHSDQLHALLTPFREQVQSFQTELQARAKSSDEDRAGLREQISMLHQRSEDISREAVALTRALKGEKQRQGAWGEMILERILEESGLEKGIHYTTQSSYRDEDGKLWRPDVIVNMPQKKVLVIDSKVSLNDYEQAVNSEDPLDRNAALKRHIAAIRTHITTLSGKGYHAVDQGSVDYVLMFIPVEGAFSEALRVDPQLASFAMEKKVGLATPTTLMLILRTVDHIWTVERRESNAMEIANRAGQLYDKVHGFLTSMEQVGTALETAQRSHGQAMDRLSRGQGNVIRQVEMLRELGARTQKQIDLDHDRSTFSTPLTSD